MSKFDTELKSGISSPDRLSYWWHEWFGHPYWAAGKPPETEYARCVACDTILLNYETQALMIMETIELPYCPNKLCNRYGLFTVGAEELA